MRRAFTAAGGLAVTGLAAVVLLPLLIVVSLLGSAAGSSVCTPLPGQPTTACGFTQLWRDDFDGTTLNPDWAEFNGDGNGHGPKARANITVHDGYGDLQAAPVPGAPTTAWGSWYGAGMCACKASVTTYGRYQVQARIVPGDPGSWHTLALTWPTGHWPPELDFLETGQPDRNTVTTHYPDPTQPHSNGMEHGKPVPVDVTGWHTYGVEWTPATVVYTLDGTPVATHTHSATEPMWLGLMVTMGEHGVHPTRPVQLLVDWAQVDSYTPTAGSTTLKPGSVPPQYAAALQQAGTVCPTVTAPLLAAQIEVESGWNPDAVSPAGAQGLSQFMPGTWASWGVDANNDGSADPFDPYDAIASQARYDCALAAQVAGIPGDPVQLTLAAYNAGIGAVRQYQGIPPYPETQNYVRTILALLPKYTAPTSPGGGPPGQPTAGIPCAAGTDQGVVAAPGGVQIRICQVGGIVVNTTLSGPLAQLLTASAAAGLHLGGGGFRSNAEQIALRRAHCGPTHYDIYEKPASQCSPPTAIPGTSMHEYGLAIDFTSNGTIIGSHSDPAWQWLNTNAATYALHNLSSEPWHFSTNGK